MKEKMKRRENFKNVSRPSNPADELAKNVSKKSPSDELLLHFSAKVQNLTVFFIHLHDSNSIFRAGRINSEWVRNRTEQQNFTILGGQDSSRRQTGFFLPIDPRDKKHKDPEHINFSVPLRARYVHSAWNKQKDAVYWVDINLSIHKGLTFCQTRSNAIILQGTLPA